jgi:DNA-binding beta-propeller fold protein YncE
VPRERKPALAALGLLLVLVGVLASVYLQQRAGDRVGVVEITKRIPQGQAFRADSLSEVMVAVDPNISYVTWAQYTGGALSRYTAETDLLPGTLLVSSMATTAVPLPKGQEVVGLSLKDGEYPVGVQAGDTVSAYYVSNKNEDKSGQQFLTDGFTAPPIFTNVLVYGVGAVSPSGSLDISLVLGQQYAGGAVQAASGGNLVLVFDKHVQ